MPSLFRTPSHRVYDLKPRYYNSTKELLSTERNKEDRPNTEAEKAKSRIKQHFGSRKKNLNMADARQTLLRVSIIAAFLILMIFWLFN